MDSPRPAATRFTHWLCALAIVSLVAACAPPGPEQSQTMAVQGLYSATFSKDAKLAIVGSINHGGSLWNFPANERKFNWNHKQGEFSQIIASAFSPDNAFALTAKPQTMVLWDLQSGAAVSYWTAPSEILDVDLLPNGDLALLGLVDHSAALFDVKNGGVRQVFYHDARVNSVAYDSNTARVLSGSDDFSARLWSASTGTELRRWEHADEVQLVEFSPDGKLAFTMAKYDKAAVWDTETGQLVNRIPLFASALRRGQTYTAAAFSIDGAQLLTGTANREIQLWDVSSMQRIKRWRMPRRHPTSPSTAAVLALAFGPQGNYLAITSDGMAYRMR
ncbi:MAG: hypothetical protein WBN40_02015 [Pseudomonadales bacterium]